MKAEAQKGFTLIELLIVIVLLGIMAVGAGMLITRPIDAYSDQVRRQQLVDSAEMAVRKIEADIRRALPNSIRTLGTASGWALEMINTVDGARYRDEAGAGFSADTDILTFGVAGDSRFNLLGRFTSLAPNTYADYRTVIYSTSPATIYSDAALNNNPGIISSPAGLVLSLDPTGIEHQLTLPGLFRFSFESPTQRLFVVDGAVSYICDSTNGILTRFEGYAYQSSQTSVDTLAELSALGASSGRVATQVSSCNIDYQPGSAQRGGLITLDLSLTDDATETIRLLHQVHVDNVP